MPHKFDTGLAKPQRTLIREAIIAKLAPLLTTANPARYVAAIKPLPRALRGEGDGDGFAMLKYEVAGKAPCILVAVGRKRYDSSVNPLEARGELEVAIYLVSSHARGIVSGRLAIDAVATADLTKDPGIEVMLEHVEELLLGQPLGIAGVDMLRPTDEDEVVTFEDFTAWELRFVVAVERVINPNRDETELVTSIEGKHEESGTAAVDGDIDIAPLVTLSNLDPET